MSKNRCYDLELSWDANVLKLEGMPSNVLSHFMPGVQSHERSGSAKAAWDDDRLTGTTLAGNEPVMIYHFRRVSEGSTGLFWQEKTVFLDACKVPRFTSTRGTVPGQACMVRSRASSTVAIRLNCGWTPAEPPPGNWSPAPHSKLPIGSH